MQSTLDLKLSLISFAEKIDVLVLIGGLVIGAVVFIAIVVVLIVYLSRKYWKKGKPFFIIKILFIFIFTTVNIFWGIRR
jgi:hypothetical protein